MPAAPQPKWLLKTSSSSPHRRHEHRRAILTRLSSSHPRPPNTRRRALPSPRGGAWTLDDISARGPARQGARG
eukprot:9031735-Pyramimonas_sp.AAC.2